MENTDWYTELRDVLEKKIKKAYIIKALSISESSDLIGRNLLIRMGASLLNWNSSDWYERRAVLTIVYSAVGRGGEVAQASWSNMRWDVEEECVVMDWANLKNSTQKGMTLHPDFSNMECCVFHSIACLLAMRGHIQSSWLFPELNALKNSCVYKLTSYLRDFVSSAIDGESEDDPKPPSVDGLGMNHTSHGLRKGSVNAICLDENASFLNAWLRDAI